MLHTHAIAHTSTPTSFVPAGVDARDCQAVRDMAAVFTGTGGLLSEAERGLGFEVDAGRLASLVPMVDLDADKQTSTFYL
jgi:hypothetical protein